MPLADGGMTAIWIVVALAIGFFGFFVMLVVLLGRALRFAVRLLWPFGRTDHAAGTGRAMPAARACRNQRCGHVNRPGARYCARCGGSLGNLIDVDSYG